MTAIAEKLHVLVALIITAIVLRAPAPPGFLVPHCSSWRIPLAPLGAPLWLLLAPPGSSRFLLTPPLVPLGSSWLNTPGSSWVPLAPPSSSWVLLVSFWFLLAPPPGSLGLLLAPPDPFWLLYVPYCSSWLLLALLISSWLLVALHGFSWLLLVPPASRPLLDPPGLSGLRFP